MERKNFSLKDIGLPKLVIMLVTGILIVLLSVPGLFGSDKKGTGKINDGNLQVVQKDMNMTSYDTNTYISEMEKKLKNILKKVSGIGDVEVMITLKASGKQIPLKDYPSIEESLNEVDGEGGSRTNNSVKRDESTVLVGDGKGGEAPYILQETEPEVEGVLVIAEGGDNVQIIIDIIEAVEVLFNVPAHKVKVMKMRSG
ncbi:MAG: stage III sporulation protein AG [Clostridiales bacterium]|nr:stage III sporulation protein AG [Clostridiales bacterium]